MSPFVDSWLHDPAGLAALIPSTFTVGTTSSAFQIEGAIRDDGREPSTWDTFMAQHDRITDGSDAAVAADHYHRYREDVRLLSELGVDSHRFSLSWPRLQPNGRGAANRSAVAFYDRFIDDLLAAGIRPMVTLHHYDLPERLQHVGGWLNRDTASRLADYAYLAGEAFGDRVDAWVTLNEPATVMLNGYALGTHAPGATLLFDALPAAHHQLLGHGLSVEALRAADIRGTVGIANAWTPIEPATDKADDALAGSLFSLIHNHLFTDPVLLGRYPTPSEELAHQLDMLGVTRFGEIEPADLATMSAPIDFYGLNYVKPTRIRAGARNSIISDAELDAMGRFPFSPAPWPEFARTGSGMPNAPEFLAVALRELGERYGEALPPVVITEAGASYSDPDASERGGAIDDEPRAVYLAEHLEAALTAAGDTGSPVSVTGFFFRSLLDGWEWTAGFSQHYGLVGVDRDTQDRTPKRSYRFLQRVLGGRS